MDKLKKAREIIKDFLQEYIKTSNRRKTDEVEDFLIVDEKSDSYIWMTWGWQGKKYIKAVQVFVRIRGDKIWIEEDWTEEGIANVLVEKGIPKESIVLGFQSPEMRKYTEFAVA